jgi:hypothetical protein
MAGRVLLSILFCLCLGATIAQSAVSLSHPNADRQSTESDSHWRDARHQTTAIITESCWKSPNVHANLADVRRPEVLAAASTVRVPPCRRAHLAPELLNSPLLI